MKNTYKKDRVSAMQRVLRRLGEPKAVGRITPEGGLAVFVAGNRFARPVVSAGPDILRLLMAEELVCAPAAQADERAISPLGRAWLRRADAQEAPFRSQHQIAGAIVETGGRGERVALRINHAESPLGWLAAHKDRTGKALISPEQFAAGEKLRRDFTLANLTPNVTAVWGMPVTGKGRGGADTATINDTVIAAKARLWTAFDAVGPELGAVLLQVCCHLNGLSEAERELGWPARAGKVVLRIALDRLAVHYGIGIGGAPKQRRRLYQAGALAGENENNLHNT